MLVNVGHYWVNTGLTVFKRWIVRENNMTAHSVQTGNQALHLT